MEQIELGKILDNPYQPRTTDNAEHIESLALSIATDGLLQVPTARKMEDGSYQLAFGHSRRKAFELLNACYAERELTDRYQGYWMMPINVEQLSDEEMYRYAVSENVQRKDLDAIELAKAMIVYRDQFGKSSDEIGALFGMNGATVRGKLRLLDLPESVQVKLAQGEISEGVGRSMLTLQKLAPDKVEYAVKEIIKGEESPQDVIDSTLRFSANNVEDMWRDHRGGKALAGYDLWELGMKRFPNNLLPELTIHEVSVSLNMEEVDGDGILMTILDMQNKDAKPETDIEKRVYQFINPPSCVSCDFYAKADGTHYCGLKACWSRKAQAWKAHLISNASKKLDIPVYDEAVDGEKYILGWNDKHYWNKGVDLRLMPKKERGSHYQGGLDGVPDVALVVLVGKSLEKKREKERTERSKEKEAKSDERRAVKEFERTKAMREALLWEVTEYFSSIFESAHDDVMHALWNWGVRAGMYKCEEAPADQEDDDRRAIILNVIHQGLQFDSIDITCNADELAKGVLALAKNWKVKVPKDWAQRMSALSVSAETES